MKGSLVGCRRYAIHVFFLNSLPLPLANYGPGNFVRVVNSDTKHGNKRDETRSGKTRLCYRIVGMNECCIMINTYVRSFEILNMFKHLVVEGLSRV